MEATAWHMAVKSHFFILRRAWHWSRNRPSLQRRPKRFWSRIGVPTQCCAASWWAQLINSGCVYLAVTRRSIMAASAKQLKLDQSRELESRARKFIPGVTQTISKRPAAFAPGYFPEYIDHARGSHVWDADGNEYIDYVMACGLVTLGYCYPAVDLAIREQLAKGIIFTRLTSLEGQVAEMLSEAVPCAEMTRFFKGGVEANSAAVRLARAFTGMEKVVSCGYRGWQD